MVYVALLLQCIPCSLSMYIHLASERLLCQILTSIAATEEDIKHHLSTAVSQL